MKWNERSQFFLLCSIIGPSSDVLENTQSQARGTHIGNGLGYVGQVCVQEEMWRWAEGATSLYASKLTRLRISKLHLMFFFFLKGKEKKVTIRTGT